MGDYDRIHIVGIITKTPFKAIFVLTIVAVL